MAPAPDAPDTDVPARVDGDLPVRVDGDPRADGRRARWADHRAVRRRELIDAAVAAVRRHGAGVGMEQIAAEAHTSKPVVYRYFDDKVDLHRAVGRRVADQLVMDVAAATADAVTPRERLEAGVDAFFEVLERDPELYRFVADVAGVVGVPGAAGPVGGRVDDYLDRVRDLVQEVLRDQLGGGAPDVLVQLAAVGLVGQVRASGEAWLAARAAVTPGTAGLAALSRRELTTQVTTWVWSGVGESQDGGPSPAAGPVRWSAPDGTG